MNQVCTKIISVSPDFEPRYADNLYFCAMHPDSFSFDDFSFGSKLIRDLIGNSANAKSFSGEFFSLDKIQSRINDRKKFPIDRKLLVQALQTQNESYEISNLTRENIAQLSNDNTFTITTGHQLNVLSGPLFSIFKIAQAIVIAEELKRKDPSNHFVPVFWMATEDHDFEEINHINLFNKKISWEKEGQDSCVAGRIETKSLTSFFEEIESLYQNDDLKNQLRLFAAFYHSSENLAQATRKLINHFFGDKGLVIIDGDDKNLKQLMKPVFKNEIQSHVTHTAVSATNKTLEQSGYHQQVHVRECNLFFIHANGKRERIVFENGFYHVDEKKFTPAEIEKQVEDNPELFSPNALLRPVYQEIVLPNLTYIGGGGEIAYWLQLKSLFEKLNVSFPLLRVRDSLFILNQKQAEDLEKTGLKFEDLNNDADQILKNMTLEKHGDALSFSDAEADFFKAKSKILEKVNAIDNGLVNLVEAEFSRMISSLEKIEAKLIKSAKSKDESAKNRILKLREKLFPHNHFQERHETILNYYLTDPEIIHKILDTIKPENEPKIRILIS